MDGADHLGKPVNGIAASLILICLATSAFGQTAAPAEIVPPPSRDVTPPGVTPAPGGEGPLTREVVPPPPPEAARWRRFHLPVTLDSATFLVNGMTIAISGVEAPLVTGTCETDAGEIWPCGRIALFSLRKFLKGRDVECYFPSPGDAKQVIAPCRVGATDLGEWLVQDGWATPTDMATDAYRTAADTARCRRLGVFRGTKPPSACPRGEMAGSSPPTP
jgi:endonuclease YncB( thermonuclease family)